VARRGCAAVAGSARRRFTAAKNLILFVGVVWACPPCAARIFDGQLRGKLGEESELAFESFPYVALAKTYSVNAQVSESAATMTALVTGVKTRADLIGLDERGVPGDYTSVEDSRARTLLEEAEARGLSTGIVTTTRITHATPASCYAHAAHRDWEDDSMLPSDAREAGFPDIARQFAEFAIGDGIDVAFGGGRAQFLPERAKDPEHPGVVGARTDGRDLVAAWQGRHPKGSWVWNRRSSRISAPARPVPCSGSSSRRTCASSSNAAKTPRVSRRSPR
jgi:alkaline phosphatase